MQLTAAAWRRQGSVVSGLDVWMLMLMVRVVVLVVLSLGVMRCMQNGIEEDES